MDGSEADGVLSHCEGQSTVHCRIPWYRADFVVNYLQGIPLTRAFILRLQLKSQPASSANLLLSAVIASSQNQGML